jgi:hypothetical protein
MVVNLGAIDFTASMYYNRSKFQSRKMARAIPISNKARNRLINSMGGNPNINIEQRKGNKIFFVSVNGKYCAWVDLSGDPHWDIAILP